MADSLEVFGFCGANCRHRVLTVDQTVALIQELAANGFQVPEGFIPKTAVNSIIEQNTGKEVRLFIGTQAEYDAWTGDKNNLFAIISDDPALKDILNRLLNLETAVASLDSALNTRIDRVIDGSTQVKKAENADNAILNSNGSYSGLVRNVDEVLKDGDIIIPQKRELEFTYSYDGEYAEGGTIEFSEPLAENDKLQIDLGYKERGANFWGRASVTLMLYEMHDITDNSITNFRATSAFNSNVSKTGKSVGWNTLTLRGVDNSTTKIYMRIGYATINIADDGTITGGAGDYTNQYDILKIYKIIE